MGWGEVGDGGELNSSTDCLAETLKREKKKLTTLISFHLPRAAPAARGPPLAARVCAHTCVRVHAVSVEG